MTSFSAWKARTMAALLQISKKYQTPPQSETLKFLIRRLKVLRARDIASFLALVHHKAETGIPELLELVPTRDEIRAIVEYDYEGI